MTRSYLGKKRDQHCRQKSSKWEVFSYTGKEQTEVQCAWTLRSKGMGVAYDIARRSRGTKKVILRM